MNKILLIVFVFLSSDVIASNRTHKNFTTDLKTLNHLTEKYSLTLNEFKDVKAYQDYPLFVSIELNQYLLHSEINSDLNDLLCAESEFDIVNLIKWEILKYKHNKLKHEGVHCYENSQNESELIMEKLLANEYPDAMVEYSKFLATKEDRHFLIENSLLTSAMYKKPDVLVLEELIKNFHGHNKIEGEWHSSLLAARYGSVIGYKNVLKLSDDKNNLEFFRLVLKYLWN